MKFIFYLFLSICYTTDAYSIPTGGSVRKISDKYFKIYEPPMTEERFFSPNQQQCLFYTGGGSEIPCEIYSSFLTKLSEKNLTVNVVNKDLKKSHIHLQSITHNKPTTIIAHSSGAIEALDACNYLDNIKKVILMDPVDSRFFFYQGEHDKIIEPRYPVQDILFLNARKSYKWKWFPPKAPFIPFFGLHSSQVKFDNKQCIIAKEFGHSDILDYPWGNIMHQTFSEGLNNRDESKIESYHEWLSTVIAEYIKNNELVNINTIEYELRER
jgi:hypothetical protein